MKFLALSLCALSSAAQAQPFSPFIEGGVGIAGGSLSGQFSKMADAIYNNTPDSIKAIYVPDNYVGVISSKGGDSRTVLDPSLAGAFHLGSNIAVFSVLAPVRVGFTVGGSLMKMRGFTEYAWIYLIDNTFYAGIGKVAFQGKGYLDIALRAGPQLGRVHLFGKVGYARHLFKANLFMRGERLPLKTKGAPCLLLGAGVNVDLTPSWALGAAAHWHHGTLILRNSKSFSQGFKIKHKINAVEGLLTLTYKCAAAG